MPEMIKAAVVREFRAPLRVKELAFRRRALDGSSSRGYAAPRTEMST